MPKNKIRHFGYIMDEPAAVKKNRCCRGEDILADGLSVDGLAEIAKN